MKTHGYTKETITQLGMREINLPDFRVGDTIAISQLIKEGDKERVQIFQGDVISIRKRGSSSSFTVRKIGAHGVAVERIFPLYSLGIKKIEVIKKGDVRRAKLYYIRHRLGRSARLKEKFLTREQREGKENDQKAESLHNDQTMTSEE